jgi:hypothetical protein
MLIFLIQLLLTLCPQLSQIYGSPIHTQDWNINLLNSTFDQQVVQQITAVPTVPEQRLDVLRWKLAKTGICTTKNIYRHLAAQNHIQLPMQGSRSILPQVNQILHKVWKSKTLPLIIKTFSLRLIRRALATAQRASTYSTHIDPSCASYGQNETDAHLFFYCNVPRAVWFSFNPSLRTDSLPHEDDGIQLILQTIITATTTEIQIQKKLITLWFL